MAKKDKLAVNVLSDPENRKKLKGVLQNCSDSLTRIAGERDFMKSEIAGICETLELDKKVVNKLVKTYFKQNFDEEVQENDAFERLWFDLVITSEKNVN